LFHPTDTAGVRAALQSDVLSPITTSNDISGDHCKRFSPNPRERRTILRQRVKKKVRAVNSASHAMPLPIRRRSLTLREICVAAFN